MKRVCAYPNSASRPPNLTSREPAAYLSLGHLNEEQVIERLHRGRRRLSEGGPGRARERDESERERERERLRD